MRITESGLRSIIPLRFSYQESAPVYPSVVVAIPRGVPILHAEARAVVYKFGVFSLVYRGEEPAIVKEISPTTLLLLLSTSLS